ncbi:hypothetical protein FRC08_002619, partial [Ceratobasidium sp. 394]
MDSDDEYQEATVGTTTSKVIAHTKRTRNEQRGPKRKVKRQKREIRAPSPAQPEDPDTL